MNGLPAVAQRLIRNADLVIGSRRQLELVQPLPQSTATWPSPLEAAIPELILARRGRAVCVLASGDPYCFGIGTTLARYVAAHEILALPQPSSFSLAAARLAWSLPDTALVTLHGRPLDNILPHLQPGARIIALSWDGETPMKLARLLTARGMGASPMTVFCAMGGPREQRLSAMAAAADWREIDPLNVVALEVVAGPGATIIPLSAGLDDGLFEHDGQITKRTVRAATLSLLAPRLGELLWDIGAGSGSVAIEWCLRHPANRAIAIEAKPDRAARAARNAVQLGVPRLEIAEGFAPAVLEGLERPDAVFVGGGGSDAAVLDAAWSALKPGGRLVVNAVTLEGESELIRRHAAQGGLLQRLSVETADALGGFRGWRPAMPVTQWLAVKP